MYYPWYLVMTSCLILITGTYLDPSTDERELSNLRDRRVIQAAFTFTGSAFVLTDGRWEPASSASMTVVGNQLLQGMFLLMVGGTGRFSLTDGRWEPVGSASLTVGGIQPIQPMSLLMVGGIQPIQPRCKVGTSWFSLTDGWWDPADSAYILTDGMWDPADSASM